ncbi:CHAT domain-containing protein [Streptomyces sp. 4N509B]|uniref:CHAT domain-containing protein n=1 Tax=Streptomyces sp. 4N509B TaxID=3457413 RepID=UPI003FD37F02
MEDYAKYQATDSPAKLDSAIGYLEGAVRQARDGSARSYAYRNNLGVALLDRHALAGNHGDLNRAIEQFRQSRKANPGDHPDGARTLANLIDALVANSAPQRELIALREEFGRMKTAPVPARLDALREAGYARAESGGPRGAFETLADAVELLPRMVWWGARAGVADPVATDTSGLATDAAACAIAAGKPERALEVLDGGRGLGWDQSLKRSDRDELKVIKPQLVKRLDQAVTVMDPVAAVSGGRMIRPRGWGLFGRLRDVWTFRRTSRLADAWDALAARAQQLLPGAALTLPQYVTLARHVAAEGPVITVVVSRFGCHALILRPDHTKAQISRSDLEKLGIGGSDQEKVLEERRSGQEKPQVIRLPGLSLEAVRDRARRYLAALDDVADTDREHTIRETLDWLQGSVTDPVVRALHGSSSLQGVATRLWWCPTGLLAALPLHAAAIDEAVSSYTPTLQVLVGARQERDRRRRGAGAPTSRERRLLLITAGETPGRENLLAAARTREHIENLVARRRLTSLDGSEASLASVKRELVRHAWVHFDCHGVQNVDQPYKTGLLLHDRTLLTVADLARLPDSRSDFAFLAACVSALPDTRMPDEMISLTSALQYSGYLHVIGTLSPASDRATERVARALYEALVSDKGELIPEDSASLLHRAVGEEREKRPDHPSAWVPFMHVGV